LQRKDCFQDDQAYVSFNSDIKFITHANGKLIDRKMVDGLGRIYIKTESEFCESCVMGK